MLQTLDNVLNAVNFRDILSHYNPARPVQYNGIRWLGTGCHALEKQYIYIGKTSQLPDNLPFEDIGLIVVRDDSRELSDLAVEVVEISPQTNVPELCLRIQEQVFRTYEVSRVSQAIIEKMFRALSIKEISDIISEHMDNPVFITFRFGNRSFFYSGDATIEAEASVLRSIRGEHADFQAKAEVERIFRSSTPLIAEDGFCYKGKRRIHIGFSDGLQCNRPIGILTVFEVRHSFQDLDYSFLSFMSYILSIKAAEPAFQREMISHEHIQYLHELIRTGHVSAEPGWESALFGSQSRNYFVALTDTRKLSSVALEDVKYRLYPISGFSTILIRGSYLVVIGNLRNRNNGALLREVEAISKLHNLIFGISEFFSDITQLRKYYTQAKRVREISHVAGVKCGVLPFETYKTTLLVRDISATGDPELFVDTSIDRLIAHDNQENTDYVETLNTYIRYGMSKERTRKALNIHRNTLTYRLNRIEEILGHRLDDSDYLVGLYFALTIRKASEKCPISED